DDAAGGAVVGDRVGQADAPVGDPRVDDLDGGQHVVGGGDDVGHRQVGPAQAGAEHEGGFEFHERVDVVLPVDGEPFGDEGARQQVPVVGLVQAEGVLHGLGDVAELEADHAVAVGHPG